MANKTGIYDFSKCILLIKHSQYAGQILIDGFAEGSNISVAKNDPRWTQKPSGDGKSTTLERNPINAGTITFSLNQSTDSLSKMNAIAQYGNTVSDLSVLFEVTLIDKSSGSVHYSQDAIVGDPETIEYGREENAREFVIACGELTSELQGSARIPLETAKIVRALGFDIDESRLASM